jgi:hypothetical protein
MNFYLYILIQYYLKETNTRTNVNNNMCLKKCKSKYFIQFTREKNIFSIKFENLFNLNKNEHI